MRKFLVDANKQVDRAVKDLAKAKEKREVAERLDSILPEGVEPVSFSEHVYCGDWSLTFSVGWHDECLDLLVMFPPTPLSYVANATVTIKPTAQVTEREEDQSSQCHDVLPVIVDVEYCDGPVLESIRWWTLIDTGTAVVPFSIKVECKFTDFKSGIQFHEDRTNNFVQPNFNKFHNRNIISWWSQQPKKNAYNSKRWTVYFDAIGSNADDIRNTVEQLFSAYPRPLYLKVEEKANV